MIFQLSTGAIIPFLLGYFVPSYDISIAAFAIGVPRKWLDNLASQHPVPGLSRTCRGVKLEFSFDAVVAVWLTRSLVDDLSIPVKRAAEIAAELQASPDGSITLASGISIRVDVESIVRTVQHQLLEAAESVPQIRRGRPPRRSRAANGSWVHTPER